MSNSILEKKNNLLITLRELLSENYYYRIPNYQRGYSWDKEFQDLWDDIKRLFHSNAERKHYTGMITLDEIKDVDLNIENLNNTSSFYIVDGQQRITSLIIILQCILCYAKENMIENVINNKSFQFILKSQVEIYRFGYSNKRKENSEDYFIKRIYKNNKNIPASNQYLININNAANLVEKELNLFDDEKISDLLNIILDKLEFNIYFITKDFDVRVTFETMNNRGKPLTNLELLKNRLMFLSTFFKKDNNYGASLQVKIDLAWKNIYDNLSFEDSQLSDDDYLKAHWGVYKKLNKRSGNAYIKDILDNEFAIDHGTFYQLFKEDKINKAYHLLENYIESLDKYSQYWAFVSIPTSNKLKISKEELEYIKRLSRLPSISFLKATTMVVLASNVNSQDKIRYYDTVEKFIFINKLIAQTKNDFSFLTTPARALLLAEKDDELTQTIKLNKIIQEIEEHEDLSLNRERIYKTIQSFAAYINDKKDNYYDWNGLKYFLYEYNEDLKIDNAAEIEWFKIKSTSIEHILPQKIKRDYWKIAFEDYIGTEDEIKIKNSLGNLLLLSSGSENSTLQDFSYPVKKDMDIDSKKFAYCYGSRSAIEISKKYEYWTPKTIYERTNNLLSFMYRRWFKDYLSQKDWNDIINKYNFINFKYNEMNPNDYNKLINKLKDIDCSDERKKVNQIIEVKDDITDFSKQLSEFFDSEYFNLKENPKQIRHIEKRFTYKFCTNNDNELQTFICGTKLNNYNYKIEYNYKENNIKIESFKDNYEDYKNYKHYKSIDVLPDNIRMFIRSFKRYIRKAKMIKDNPKII